MRLRSLAARIRWTSVGAGFALAWALYFLLQASTVADWLVRPLQLADTAGAADAIVVLGAGYFEPCGLNLPSMRRTTWALELHEQGRAPLVLFTGGKTRTSGEVRVGHEMARLARSLGLPPEDVLEEQESRNTWENAKLGAEILHRHGARRILLVTDSIHMRRADACFRKLGFEIERSSVPQVCVSASNLGMLRNAVHEYVGLVYYALRGYTTN